MAGLGSPTHDDAGIYRDSGSASGGRNRMSFTSTLSEEKENGETAYPRTKISPELRYAGSTTSSGRGSPARSFRAPASYRDNDSDAGGVGIGITRERPTSSLPTPSGANGAESWKRAAEVTSQLKARIELMKVSSHFPICPSHRPHIDPCHRPNKASLDLKMLICGDKE